MNGFEIQCLPGAGCPVVSGPQASGLAQPDDWLFEALTWGPSDSGECVNPVTALSHGPVWQAINVLGGDVGQLPLHKMRWSTRGDKTIQERDEDHPLDWLLCYQPNLFQTPSVWKETMMSWALGWGNGISALMRDARGERWFLPLLPDRTSYAADDEYGYLILSEVNGRRVALSPEEVFHIRGLTSNGFWGLSAVSMCKNRIAHGMAMLKHGNSTFRNGCRPSGVLEHPSKLSPEARDNLRTEWRRIHGGAANTGEVAILWEGMKYNTLSMSNEDAQWLEGMDLDREFVAGLFNLPPYKLGAMKNSAVRANLEEQNKDYLNASLGRWLNRFVEECERKLLSMRERRSKEHSFMWRTEAFLQGNTSQLMEAISKGVSSEVLTRNEGRERLGLNPIDDPKADALQNPNTGSAKQASDGPAPPSTDDAMNEPEKKPDEAAMALARSLVRSQVASMLEVEANRIERAAKTANNFVRSAGDFYENYTDLANKYLQIPAEIAKNSGFSQADWRLAAELHSQDSWNRLLTLTELVNRDGLAEAATQFASGVRTETERLTAAVLGGETNA